MLVNSGAYIATQTDSGQMPRAAKRPASRGRTTISVTAEFVDELNEYKRLEWGENVAASITHETAIRHLLDDRLARLKKKEQ